jgi:DNA-binding MarR family transcriptional regulator
MSLTQLSTLSTLADGGPRRITDLAAIQGVAQPSITEMVAILERAGYVERHRDPLDGRASLAALTAGRDCLRDRRRIASQSLAQLVAMLPAAERAALNAAVPALVHLRELDGGAVRSADAGHGPVVARIGHQGMAR